VISWSREDCFTAFIDSVRCGRPDDAKDTVRRGFPPLAAVSSPPLAGELVADVSASRVSIPPGSGASADGRGSCSAVSGIATL